MICYDMKMKWEEVWKRTGRKERNEEKGREGTSTRPPELCDPVRVRQS